MFWLRGWALITAWALIRGNTVFELSLVNMFFLSKNLSSMGKSDHDK